MSRETKKMTVNVSFNFVSPPVLLKHLSVETLVLSYLFKLLWYEAENLGTVKCQTKGGFKQGEAEGVQSVHQFFKLFLLT